MAYITITTRRGCAVTLHISLVGKKTKKPVQRTGFFVALEVSETHSVAQVQRWKSIAEYCFILSNWCSEMTWRIVPERERITSEWVVAAPLAL